MKFKKVIAVSMTAAMALSMLTACGGGDTAADSNVSDSSNSESADASGGENAASGSTDSLEVKIWDSMQKDGIETICNEWSATSGIPVNVEVVNWDSYWTLLEAGVSGGEMPDVFWSHSNYIQKYMDAEVLLPLNDYIEKDETMDLNNFFPDIVELYTNDDGTHYAIPKDYDTIALFYNKKMFDDAGLSYPDDTWTWEDLYENAKQLTKEDGSQYGIGINTDLNQESYYNIIYSYGGYVISDDHKKSGMDDPKTIEAMEMWGKVIKDCMPPQTTLAEADATDLFTSGVTAMQLAGSWRIASLKSFDEASDWAVAQIPYCDQNGNGQCDEGERVSIYNGLGWAAPADCADPDAAYSLISYLCSKEGQTRQAELGVTMSAYMGTSDSWKNSTDLWDLSPFLDEANGSAKLVIYPYSRSTIWAEDMKQQLVAAWNDTSLMAQVCQEIADSMNAQLAQE